MAEVANLDRRMSFSYKAATTRPPDQRPPHSRVEDDAAVEKRYAIGQELGRGSFGIVREVTSRFTGELLAVKTVNKDKPGSTSIQMLTREVEVLKRLDHPHIIKLEDILETPQVHTCTLS
ncbi:Serine/threonine-protein kinase 33 [Geodia barretti]|uniref:Serine/threonine-protein kinase 33 n=1 Tax=Geodia barretti TaxID=519541 RepID=A0AA35SY47_GEOBA|nr:Serine/threonine-protein kinase 33 [Geodia barretti]